MNGYSEDERKLVCNSCGKILPNIEPDFPNGKYFHKKRDEIICPNDTKNFSFLLSGVIDGKKIYDTIPPGFSLFEKKSVRRNTKKMARKARRARTY